MEFIKTLSLFAIFSLAISQNWSVNIRTEINLWNSNNIATDYENYLGVNENALDSYDILDVPEPPTIPNNYISLYFYQKTITILVLLVGVIKGLAQDNSLLQMEKKYFYL